jgi:hypothetical protein
VVEGACHLITVGRDGFHPERLPASVEPGSPGTLRSEPGLPRCLPPGTDRPTWMLSRSDVNDLYQPMEGLEVIRIAGVQGKTSRAGCRRNQEIDGSRSASLSAGPDHSGVHAAIRARCLRIERKRIEDRLGALQTVLPSGSLVRVLGGVGPGRELGHRDRADRRLDGKALGVEAFEVDDHGRVE